MGGHKGQYPIANLDWATVGMIDSLPARLAVQHRTFEAGSLDMENEGIPLFRELGDDAIAEMMEAIEADEIAHVRFANEWIKRLTDADPRAVLKVAAAMTWLKRVIAETGGHPLHEIKTDAKSRELAGFSSEEIAVVSRLEEVVRQEVVGQTAHEPAR
jgi:uncharacterized ferritin-like protein (DUF455 family)